MNNNSHLESFVILLSEEVENRLRRDYISRVPEEDLRMHVNEILSNLAKKLVSDYFRD